MSFFRPEPEAPYKEKDIKQHPWTRTIKDNYSSKIKHAHNSIKNPTYPVQKEKQPASDRAKFTIIGDRVTKEFIYCTKLVKGLHKYRWKNFEAPVIRGVNTVEWPAIWNELKIRYGGLVYCLKSSILVLLNNNVIGGEKELKELVETKYIYHLCLDYYNEGIAEFAKFIRSSSRPCAYMHISINDNHIGSLIFLLFADIVPYTCENFLRLCKDKRGGYGGTPVHRIVKDGWIQCGGFGLKSIPLDCENYIVPLDKRGILGMANDGRHVDCSTQFFVLLQPAPWMSQKYVAFGELIEGEATLKQIESVATHHESPTSSVIIYQTGIFNMECQDIMINKNANEYIHGHIENLVALGDAIWEYLLERVFLEAQMRETAKLEAAEEGGEGSEVSESGIRATQRFNRKREDIQQQIGGQSASRRATAAADADADADDNKDFDVEEYEYEPEQHSAYSHLSLHTPSLIVKPEIPYYIPLTDVPYPGEVDSNFDLKRLLQGDYCLESDLLKNTPIKAIIQDTTQYSSEIFDICESESVSEQSIDSDDEKEIKKYIKMNVDRVSFAGEVIKTIARGKARFNLFEKTEFYSDEDLRRMRLASVDSHAARDDRHKKVSISAPKTENAKIKRRQTGFVRPQDLEKIHVFSKTEIDDDDDDDDEAAKDRKVRISAPFGSTPPSAARPARRPTGFVRPPQKGSDEEIKRQSVLARLYDEVTIDDTYGPTLKDYKPMSESHRPMNILLTYSSNARIIRSDEDTREKYMRHSLTVDNESFEEILNLQHGKQVARKISSDYVKTIDQIEHKLETSLRSVEFARLRPAISVHEYQQKNKKYQEGLKMLSESDAVKTVMKPSKDFDKTQSTGGIRLPGDTPLYSMDDMI